MLYLTFRKVVRRICPERHTYTRNNRRICRWKGLPDSVAHSSVGALQREKHERERSLDKKKEQLAELLVQQIAFRNLASRNRSNATARAAAGIPADSAGEGAGCEGEQDPDDMANSKVCDFALFGLIATFVPVVSPLSTSSSPALYWLRFVLCLSYRQYFLPNI